MPMGYFPVFLEMAGRRCLVVGGGAVAERKIANLLQTGADITVISPAVLDSVAGWAHDNLIQLKMRRYQSGDLYGFQLVFVATNDRTVNAEIFQDSREQGIWVNVADDPKHCDFILPSVLRRGDLAVAVSSGGKSPALVRAIREELESYFTEEYEQLTALAAEVRVELQKRSMNAPFEVWRRALNGDVRRLLMRGEIAQAKSALLRELGVSL